MYKCSNRRIFQKQWPDHGTTRYEDESDFIPVISGGLVATTQKWWKDSGGFDPGMRGALPCHALAVCMQFFIWLQSPGLRSRTRSRHPYIISCVYIYIYEHDILDYISTFSYLLQSTYQKKFRSQTSDNMDRWKGRGGKSQWGEEKKWEDQRRGREGRKRMQVREKVGKSRFHSVFSNDLWLRKEGRKVMKSRFAKAAGAEPAGQMRDEKLHAVVARRTFWSQNVKNT